MLFPLGIAGSLTLSLGLLHLPATAAQACAAGSAQEIAGNWYCSQVNAITYSNFPGQGYYNKVTNMDAVTGACSSVQYEYSGSLSPLNEELSLHVRGPTWLKQMAVYMPTASASKAKRNWIGRGAQGRHGHTGHQYLHNKHGNVKNIQEKRSVGEMISATIDGKLVSWINEYSGLGTATDLPAPVGVGFASTAESVGGSEQSSAASQVPIASTATSIVREASSSIVANTGTGGWTRQAYYNAADGTAEGVIFLNHFGGVQGIPGTQDGGPAFGASLSYASSDGQSGAASAQTLSNVMLQDDAEVVIMSNKSCDDGGCGYTRPGGVAYHGFPGSRKLFLLEFSMPSTGKTSFNGDMPAIWLHNAQIPLTSQYGTNPECSCWTSGCGEFDLFEILDSGNFRCKSTLHMAPAGGSSDWFQRPTNETITAAVVFGGSDENAIIRVLGGGQTFERTLTGEVVSGWASGESSWFKMGS